MQIEKNSSYRFFYNKDDVDVNQLTSVDAKDQSVGTILGTAFKGTPYSFKELENKLILIEKVDAQSSSSILNSQQQKSISGKVTESSGASLPGVSVVVNGTTIGITTDNDGNYNLQVPNDATILTFSFVGMKEQEFSIGDKKVIDVILDEEAIGIKDVVVTALGIKRDKKALGYSFRNSGGDNLSQAKEANMATSLSGKFAGVQVTRAGNGAGGSSRIIIRGANSLAGNSQPLYVVDGIPIDNGNVKAPSNWGGIDYGDGISNVNPEDIETISVLKGPNAAALYGQRGSNGVVLITTKNGKAMKGIGVKFSSDYSIGKALVFPDFQDVYGQGLDGTFTNIRGNDGKFYTMAAAIACNIQGTPKVSGGRDRFTRGAGEQKWMGNPMRINMVTY